MIKIAIPLVVFSGLIIVGNWYVAANANYELENKNDDISRITTFADCVAAGNPVMESYPEQCRTADGRTFTNAVSAVDGNTFPTQPSSTEDTEMATALEAVRAYAAIDLAVDASTIDIIAVDDHEWPDGCLGLGGPDDMCIMMLTFGYEVTLTAGDTTAIYRTDQTGAVIKIDQLL